MTFTAPTVDIINDDTVRQKVTELERCIVAIQRKDDAARWAESARREFENAQRNHKVYTASLEHVQCERDNAEKKVAETTAALEPLEALLFTIVKRVLLPTSRRDDYMESDKSIEHVPLASYNKLLAEVEETKRMATEAKRLAEARSESNETTSQGGRPVDSPNPTLLRNSNEGHDFLTRKDIATIEVTIGNNQKQVDNLRTEFKDTLQKRFEEHESYRRDIAAIKDAVRNNENQLHNFRAEARDMLQRNNKDRESHRNDIAMIEDTIKKNTKHYDSLRTEVSNTLKEHAKDLKSHSEDIASIEDTVQQYTKDRNSYRNDIAMIKDTIRNNTRQFDTIRTEVSNTLQKHTEDCNSYWKEITSIEDTLQEHTKDRELYRKEITSIEDTLQKHAEDHESQRHAIATIEDTIKTHQKQIGGLCNNHKVFSRHMTRFEKGQAKMPEAMQDCSQSCRISNDETRRACDEKQKESMASIETLVSMNNSKIREELARHKAHLNEQQNAMAQRVQAEVLSCYVAGEQATRKHNDLSDNVERLKEALTSYRKTSDEDLAEHKKAVEKTYAEDTKLRENVLIEHMSSLEAEMKYSIDETNSRCRKRCVSTLRSIKRVSDSIDHLGKRFEHLEDQVCFNTRQQESKIMEAIVPHLKDMYPAAGKLQETYQQVVCFYKSVILRFDDLVDNDIKRLDRNVQAATSANEQRMDELSRRLNELQRYCDIVRPRATGQTNQDPYLATPRDRMDTLAHDLSTDESMSERVRLLEEEVKELTNSSHYKDREIGDIKAEIQNLCEVLDRKTVFLRWDDYNEY